MAYSRTKTTRLWTVISPGKYKIYLKSSPLVITFISNPPNNSLKLFKSSSETVKEKREKVKFRVEFEWKIKKVGDFKSNKKKMMISRQ